MLNALGVCLCKTLGTAARPPREKTCGEVPKLLAGVLDEGSDVLLHGGHCIVELRLMAARAVFMASMLSISLTGAAAVFLVRRVASLFSPVESIMTPAVGWYLAIIDFLTRLPFFLHCMYI